MKNMSIRNKMTISFTIVIVLFMITSVVSLKSIKRLSEDSDWVNHTFEVLKKTEMVLGDLKDAETGQRGFIITGLENYLEPYNSALNSVRKNMSDLQYLTIDNDFQQQQINILNTLIIAKFDELEITINKRKTSFNAAKKIVVSDEGKKIMDNIRFVMNEMTIHENDLLKEREALSKYHSKNTIIATILITIIVFVIVIILILYFTRIIAFPISKLSIIAKQIAIGDLSGKVGKTDRKDEIGILSESFNMMQQYMRKKATQANHISKGNLKIEVKPLSNNDTMGIAFTSMLDNLRSHRRDQSKSLRVIEQKEKYLQTVFSGAVDGIITINEKGIVEEFNLAAERIFQYKAREIIGQNIKIIANLHDRKHHDQYLKNYKKTQKAKVIGVGREVVGVKKDGTDFPLRLAVNKVYIGGKFKYVGMLQDLTESKRQTEELEKSRKAAMSIMQDAHAQRERAENALNKLELSNLELKKLNQAIEQSVATIVITDKAGVMEYVNPAFTKISGYTFEEAIGHKPGLLKSGKHTKGFYKNMWDTILAGKIWKGDFINKKKTGEEFWESVSISPMFNKHGNISNFISVKEDITKRKKIEEELKKSKDQAEQANKAKSTFLANMSHEIRTPMNAILGFSEILSKQINDQSQINYLNSIKASGKMLLDLINNILDLSKIESGKFDLIYEATNIKVLVQDVISMFAVKTKENNLELDIFISEDLPNILFLEELRVKQVLINLINNSIKFTEHGYIKLGVTTANKTVDHLDLILMVEDTGIGIPKKYHDKVFHAFEMVDTLDNKKYEGTGLGLAITHKLVKLMNGRIELNSKEGIGSTFTITLEKVKYSVDDYEFEEKIEFDPELIVFEEATVLIVDDIKSNRDVLIGYLSDYKFNIIEAENGKEAINAIERIKPDLIFLDLRMPVMDGYKAISIIQGNPDWSQIPIIAITASVFKKEKKRVEEMGFKEFLRKPASLNDILKLLMKYLKYKDIPIQNEEIHDALIEHIDKLEELIEEIGQKVVPVWEEIKNIRNKKKVLQLAKLLIEIGEIYKATTLINYGRELKSANQTFNIDKEKNLIRQFPGFVKKLNPQPHEK